ncbi:Protein PLM2 [Madurella mycetomatis]|uniref:Protein PLM2 n=1 Tax=Madurella mycetomatis TaxID=100816 RepID=A0A175W8U3_9PEZI|nr:Protein PLM2 [Madurella mycetomatis]
MDSSPMASSKVAEPTLPTLPSLPSVAGVKRPAPSLLPPFEPLSSSPGLPRPSKRQANSNAFLKYPTPVPTSSTGILSSSPPRVGPRPVLQRTQSIASERAPLSDVPSVELNENGETLLMGRSSSSSHFQLPASRLISRIHVKARYIAATGPLETNKIEITCNGWNGLKLHCQGQTWDLAKGSSFVSDAEGAAIMIDVQDARVIVHWPRRDKDHDALGHLSDSSWDESPRPRIGRGTGGSELHGSPLRRTTRICSPESPTPANVSTSGASLGELMLGNGDEDDAAVQIYEDASADENGSPKRTTARNANTSFLTQATESFSSDLSDPQSDGENDPNEENDPIIHSFGPFGANLSGRLASFSTMSPIKQRVSRNPLAEVSAVTSSTVLQPLGSSNAKPTTTADKPNTSAATLASTSGLSSEETATITNHVVNQLAFSRLSSTPLSTIMNNLPADERKDLEKEQLRMIIESTACVGIIRRQGKDAAGKPLESEYYYTPELDTDEHRRLAVTDGLRKPTLRACRKQHKVSSSPMWKRLKIVPLTSLQQYYWKRPRTP